MRAQGAAGMPVQLRTWPLKCPCWLSSLCPCPHPQMCGFAMKPAGFFGANPCLDLPYDKNAASVDNLSNGYGHGIGNGAAANGNGNGNGCCGNGH